MNPLSNNPTVEWGRYEFRHRKPSLLSWATGERPLAGVQDPRVGSVGEDLE